MGGRGGGTDQHVRPRADQLSGERWKGTEIALRGANFERDVPALVISKTRQFGRERKFAPANWPAQKQHADTGGFLLRISSTELDSCGTKSCQNLPAIGP